MKKLIPALLFLAATPFAWGQTYPINGGNIAVCSGALLDSGGEGGAGYSNNEDFTITICPGEPDSAISLNFVIFNLSAAGSIPTDHLSIYDGNSTAAPLLGTWYGTDSPGIVSASFANTSGCLTVQFTSNETGTGVFAASITCSHPCEPPTAAAVMSEPAPALICQGESLGFDGSASTAASGQAITQYLWDFGDGVLDSLSGPVVNHVFQGAPAQHVVHLTVTDDNGCVNTNQVDLPVQISTTPTYTGFNNLTHCAGEPVNLSALTSVSGTLWTSIPDANFGGGLELPDELGTPFSSSLTFSAFPAGATLTSINDLLSVCISMEHSFMGDFVLQLTSPSGVTVVFHQQGGGGTYLGIPNDNDEGNPQIGTCWEYCFSPSATNGTWVDNAGGGTLPAGTYESLNPMSAFVGSPLNGTWTLTFTDLWGADNGFICSWGINFAPGILPEDASYTPTPGVMHSDSSYWSGTDLTSIGTDPTVYIANPLTVGPHVYTYTVTDNFGCTYDTTLTINITPGVNFDVSAMPPTVCGNPILLQPGLQLPLPTGTISYQWSPGAGLSSTTSPFPSASPTVPTWYTLHAFPAGHPLCGMVDSVLVNPLTTMSNDSIVTDNLCHGDDTGSIEVVTTGDGGPWNYTWTDGSGAVVQTTTGAIGDTFQGPAGMYQVLIAEGANGNGCTDSLVAVLNEPPPLVIATTSADTTICLAGTAELQAAATGGTDPLTLHWDHALGTGPSQAVSPSQSTTYGVYATDGHNCYSDTANLVVTVRPALELVVADTVESCPLVDVLLGADSVAGGDGQYRFDWGLGLNTADTMTVNTRDSQTFCLTLTDGCGTPPVTACTRLEITPVPPLVLTADSTLGCKPFATHFSMQDTTGGAWADWDFHDGPVLSGRPMAMSHVYDRFGTYDLGVTVHWPNGCTMDTLYSNLVTVIDMPNADFSWTPVPPDIFSPEVHFHELAGPTATSFLWDFAGLGSSTEPNPSFTFSDEQGRLYPVRLWATNSLGCTDSMLRIVNVDDVFLVHVPTAFSPDGDGINELLEVVGNDISTADFHFMIFDRWGEKVFDTTDPNKGWDGKYNGKAVPVGVYAWMLRAQSVYTGNNHDLRGHVTVIR